MKPPPYVSRSLFALTLTIGLLANVFTAYFVSRTMFELTLSRRQVAKLSI